MAFMERTEKVEQILERYFDPRQSFKDRDNRPLCAASVKYRYLKGYLNSRWEEAVGAPLARSCRAEAIEHDVLYVRTDSSMLASQLFMMKDDFLRRVNGILAGRLVLKDARFQSGRRRTGAEPAFAQAPAPAEAGGREKEPRPPFAVSRCPACGAKMLASGKLCSVCAREKRRREAEKIRELLLLQPWLSCEKALTYCPQCDKMLFMDEKSKLQSFYFERVRLGHATEAEEQTAVMLLTGRSPEEITLSQAEGALQHLRRNAYVPASGIGLHGKKQ